jgi:hypothetical protein
MQVHIGKQIRERMKLLKISPAFLAEKINTSRQNIYGIFQRKSIDTDLLVIISRELSFDFFQLYRIPQNKPSEKYVSRKEFEEIKSSVEKLAKEMKEIRRKFKSVTLTRKKGK